MMNEPIKTYKIYEIVVVKHFLHEGPRSTMKFEMWLSTSLAIPIIFCHILKSISIILFGISRSVVN